MSIISDYIATPKQKFIIVFTKSKIEGWAVTQPFLHTALIG